MPLTTAQKAALKAAILADSSLQPMTSGPTTDVVGLTAALNAQSSPAVSAWAFNVPVDAIDEASNWTAFDGLTAGKRDSWAMFMARPRDFTRAKVRTWVTDVWGPATVNSSAAAVLIAGTVTATRAQVMIGGNTVSTGSVSALKRDWNESLVVSDIVSMFAE